MSLFSISNKSVLVFLGVIILFLLLGYAGMNAQYVYEEFQAKKIEKRIDAIHKIADKNFKERSDCEELLTVDREIFSRVSLPGEKRKTINTAIQSCERKYNIANANLEINFCSKVIVGRKKDFENEYIILDGFSDLQNECSLKYLTVSFLKETLFDVEHDFKSRIHIEFGLPFYEDTGDRESEEFLENRIAAKERLIDILSISPDVILDIDDIILYPKKAIVYMDLKPETEYKISMKEYESRIEGEEVQVEPFVFTTPENKYFGLRTDDKVSLFQDTNAPSMELVSYDSGKNGADIRICRITNEQYAKIEVFRESLASNPDKNNFFRNGIDKIPTLDCKTKNISFSETDKVSDVLYRKTFDFNNEIGELARSGLYYVTFDTPEDRELAEKVQQAIFFGIVDSHITMKVSKNGEAFFFVNDFAGNPLEGQNIRVDTNEFISQKTEYNRETKENDITYFSPIEANVFGTGVLLGQTNEDGILQVNIKDEIDGAFEKMSQAWSFDYDGNHNSFFVTSSSETNLSYTSSKWNGGILAWNFGYTLGRGWWYGESQNKDNLELNTWQEEPELYMHTFTDRRLYLPGEEVYLKFIVRNSRDLSIPEGKTLMVEVRDPSQAEGIMRELEINEFGSASTTIFLDSEAPLGSYYVGVKDGDTSLGETSFSVEIFKNPKFQNEIGLSTEGLNDEVVNITDTKVEKTSWGYEREIHVGDFSLKAIIDSQYYSGAAVANSEYTYKVYKQYYYDNSYWADCYYGCYWEPHKELYTEGKGKTDENGKTLLDIPVQFESRYSDYKYILEVTVTDDAGDTISGTNSIIARLPTVHKRWDNNNSLYLETEKRFYEAGTKITLDGGLSVGEFTEYYDDEFVLIVKKKDYIVSYVEDVNGESRPVTSIEEKLETLLSVNRENFSLTADGKLELDYELKESGEYVFEYGKVNRELPYDFQKLREELIDSGGKPLTKTFEGEIEMNYTTLYDLYRYCDGDEITCSSNPIIQDVCKAKNINDDCRDTKTTVSIPQIIHLKDLISEDSRKYFTLVAYGDDDAKNPVESDNKITVLGEKVSYKLGEKARILVRLPFSEGKILLTIEKQGVLSSEYIDVSGNIFFKEIEVDETFVPNAYIGVLAVDTNFEEVPEYKVGYTEIVVDKTDKKSEVAITSNKKTYEPREEVTLDIAVTNANDTTSSSELTVMVVDDSLISLMGNIDLGVLEKMYKKLPFQIQTSITNISMLRNYYFSRQGVVGGSGYGNFKGGDSAVSSRSIFKNTAYYNGNVITGDDGKAQVSFTLPDNLTNFRVMVISQGSDNFFGYNETFIEVRKEVLVEDKTPLILRYDDSIELGANVFNTTDSEIGFKATLTLDGVENTNPEQEFKLGGGESRFITWNVKNTTNCLPLEDDCSFPYTISVLGDSASRSDKLEGNIVIAPAPAIIQNDIKTADVRTGESEEIVVETTENTDIDKSQYILSVSNDPFLGIENIFRSLVRYPYGCIEQTLSSTLPNAIAKRLSNMFADSDIKPERVERNLENGLERILDMQLESGGFGYWRGDTFAELAITPYVLRTLMQLKNAGIEIPDEVLKKTSDYLLDNTPLATQDVQIEILWALAEYQGSDVQEIYQDMDIDLSTRWNIYELNYHDLLSYTYALILIDAGQYKETIDRGVALLLEGKPETNYVGYYSAIEDKALLTQLLIEYNYDVSEITNLIVELYSRDWKSYWYSTKSKNAAFLAFTRYMEVYGSEYQNTVGFTFNGVAKDVNIDSENGVLESVRVLAEVLSGQTVSLQIENKTGVAPIFVTSEMEIYPLDPLAVKPFSNGMTVRREIYEVTDESSLEEECSWEDGTRTCIPATGLTRHVGDEFKKGVTYKIKLIADIEDEKTRENLTMEDYLPAGFSILNSKFKTNTIATAQASTGDRWSWSHTEKRPEGVMAHSRYSWGNKAEYEYFVRADFAGEFIYPPVAAYMMYQPTKRANNEFRRITIK